MDHRFGRPDEVRVGELLERPVGLREVDAATCARIGGERAVGAREVLRVGSARRILAVVAGAVLVLEARRLWELHREDHGGGERLLLEVDRDRLGLLPHRDGRVRLREVAEGVRREEVAVRVGRRDDERPEVLRLRIDHRRPPEHDLETGGRALPVRVDHLSADTRRLTGGRIVVRLGSAVRARRDLQRQLCRQALSETRALEEHGAVRSEDAEGDVARKGSSRRQGQRSLPRGADGRGRCERDGLVRLAEPPRSLDRDEMAGVVARPVGWLQGHSERARLGFRGRARRGGEQRPQLGEQPVRDARDLAQLLERGEPAGALAVHDDALGEDIAHAGQREELLARRAVDVNPGAHHRSWIAAASLRRVERGLVRRAARPG